MTLSFFGTDENQFQANLDLFFEYDTTWKLDINYDKTKTMIFGTRNDTVQVGYSCHINL